MRGFYTTGSYAQPYLTGPAEDILACSRNKHPLGYIAGARVAQGILFDRSCGREALWNWIALGGPELEECNSAFSEWIT